MSRAAVYDALINDPVLQAAGFDASSILVNYDSDQRPNDEMFIVLSWGVEAIELRGDDGQTTRKSRPLEVWVHCYREFSTDFVRIDNTIKTIDGIMSSMVQVAGSDGYTLTLAEVGTASRDLKDDTYQTICRSASYKILSRETTA
jgi:hypothetical protein